MPLVDMPLDELQKYEGRNPRPADFDEYWDKSIAEMQAIDPDVKLTLSEFQVPFADCYDMYYTGVGGARIYSKLLKPKNIAKPAPAVVMFHGYSGHCGEWTSKLGYAAMGYTVAAMDCRGQGGKSEDVGGHLGNTLHGHFIRGLDGLPEKMLLRDMYLDTAQLTKIVMDMPEVDATRVGATGGSQGGGLTLACVAIEPRVKLAAPAFPFLCDYKRVWEMDLAVGAYQELKDYFRNFDPKHEREDAIFTQLGYVDVQHLAPRIKAEVMMGVGLMDTICPPSTQYAAYNKIQSKKSTTIFPDFGHEALPNYNDEVFQFLCGL